MTEALNATQRSRLEWVVGRARGLLEADLADQAAGRFGIDPDGTIAVEDDLRLDPAELATRRDLVDVVAHLRSEGDDPPAAVIGLLREAVFTHLNRLVAIRIAEALGLLPASLADGRRSQGFRDVLELAPLLAADDTGAYWSYLQLCGDELAGDVPTLFDPRNPLLSLAPSPGALDDLVELLADPAAAKLWTAPDCLGWVYQFFNTAEERKAMRDAGAPRNSRELAVRNQFFTPRYVVDFLIQNSLGRRLLEANPESPLLDELPLLIDPPTVQGDSASLDDVSVLDPACGSGHFLLAAYDILERAWHHAGLDAGEAAPYIVRSLWGIDIDPRCSQVAAAAIIFRARRSCPEGDLPRPNIVCARALPRTSTGLDEFIAALPNSERRIVERFTEALADAPILGSLLKIEERLATEVRTAAFGGDAPPGTLADALPTETLQALEDKLLTSLSMFADSTTATPAERLLAAEADDAIRYVQALQRRYDAVLMNPPFGEPVPETKPYLKAAYPWIPTRDYNLLAAFVGRGIELCKPMGFVGAITSRAGMFLTTFEEWRQHVLLGHHLVALVDLGYGVMEQAMVEAAAYVVGAANVQPGHRATFVRLLRDVDRPAALTITANAARHGLPDHRVFELSLRDLSTVPGSPIAYWMSTTIRNLFRDLPALESNGAEARVGLQTGDDFRFVRLFWEVSPSRIVGTNPNWIRTGRWIPFAKGGDYSPYWSDVHLLVDWRNDGKDLRDFTGSVVRNPQYYFRPGVTWPKRTASGFGFGPRVLPSGTIFSQVGYGAFAVDGNHDALLGIMTSRLFQALVLSFMAAGEETTSGSPAKEYTVGVIQRVPWLGAAVSQEAMHEIAELAAQIAMNRRVAGTIDESTPSFVGPFLHDLADIRSLDDYVTGEVAWNDEACVSAVDLAYQAEQTLHRELGITKASEAYLDEELGNHPAGFPAKPLDDYDLFASLYSMPIDAMIDTLVESRGGGRAVTTQTFIADRKLEVLSHVLERHPAVLAKARRELGLSPPGARLDVARRLFSYLVGVAFGRWDVRSGRDPSAAPPLPGLFDPLRASSPGVLTVTGEASPTDYPIALPPAGLLIDELGHRWDVPTCLIAAADVLFNDSERLVAELLQALGQRDLRDHLRKRFFKDHLSRYSKSRRRAPIYWPLYVPSGSWGLWVYAPTLSRETLFAIARAAADRLDGAAVEMRRLQRERDTGGAGRSAREAANALEAEEQLAEELRQFRDEAERIAGLGWEPDLDDGIILCAAPLADLFPAWKDAAAARKEIKATNYPWATVSRWADQL